MRLSKRLPTFHDLFGEESPSSTRRNSYNTLDNIDTPPTRRPPKPSEVEITPTSPAPVAVKTSSKTVSEAADMWTIKYEDLTINFDELVGIGAFGKKTFFLMLTSKRKCI